MSAVRPSLNRRLALERFDGRGDSAGGVTGAWRLLGWVWADLGAVSLRESAAGARISHRAVLRWAPEGDPLRPAAGMRLREAGRVFTVLAAAEADAQFRFLTCWLEEAAAT